MNLEPIAEYMLKRGYRFIDDTRIRAMRVKFNASRDDVRTAAIMADRLRRAGQATCTSNSFTVRNVVPLDAPIKLPIERRRRT